MSRLFSQPTLLNAIQSSRTTFLLHCLSEQPLKHLLCILLGGVAFLIYNFVLNISEITISSKKLWRTLCIRTYNTNTRVLMRYNSKYNPTWIQYKMQYNPRQCQGSFLYCWYTAGTTHQTYYAPSVGLRISPHRHHHHQSHCHGNSNTNFTITLNSNST